MSCKPRSAQYHHSLVEIKRRDDLAVVAFFPSCPPCSQAPHAIDNTKRLSFRQCCPCEACNVLVVRASLSGRNPAGFRANQQTAISSSSPSLWDKHTAHWAGQEVLVLKWSSRQQPCRRGQGQQQAAVPCRIAGTACLPLLRTILTILKSEGAARSALLTGQQMM